MGVLYGLQGSAKVSGAGSLLVLVDFGRDPLDERVEIACYLEEQSIEPTIVTINEAVGRAPAGPAPGSRARERRARSCDRCEGDLWVETDDGRFVPCACRERRTNKRAHGRLQAGNWWRGTSLSFAAPPLSLIPPPARDAVEQLCGRVRAGQSTKGLWLIGESGTGKSALAAYIAQRLYPSRDCLAERLGDMTSHLRWLGAVKGEVGVEQHLKELTQVPLLVVDDLDRPERTVTGESAFSMRASCASQDLLRLVQILKGRNEAMLPTVVTSRALSSSCVEQMTAIQPHDLALGLLATVVGSSPFEDFPDYTTRLLDGAMQGLQAASEPLVLESSRASVLATA